MKSWPTRAAVVLLFVVAASADDPLVVDTPSGKVRGYTADSRSGRKFMAFSGVPYARPPLNDLRFEPPLRVKRWDGVRNALDAGPYCLQYLARGETRKVAGSEDCLYLSLYTQNTNGKAPVLVHFHGGGFYLGEGARWTEPQYLMDHDLVVVDVNFRISFMGFLSFEDEEMPGNQGLKDQVMALRWVQDNIASFGGDPKRVTIVGEGTGGSSAYHHTVSKMSRGLFHGAICESGTSYTSDALAPPGFAKSVARRLAKSLDCPISSTRSAVSCLKSKPGSEIVRKLLDFAVIALNPYVFWPCLEPEGPEAFLTGPVRKWRHEPVPMIIGLTSGEAIYECHYFIEKETLFKFVDDNWGWFGPTFLQLNGTASDPAFVSREVRQFYLPENGIAPENWFKMVQMVGDRLVTIGSIEGANMHTGDVFFYYFDYIGEHTYNEGANRTIYFGSPRAHEIKFLWMNPITKNKALRGRDLRFSQKLVQLWSDFVKFGNPAPEGSGISWRKWDKRYHNYLRMSNLGMEEEDGLAMDRYKFWKSIDYKDNFD